MNNILLGNLRKLDSSYEYFEKLVRIVIKLDLSYTNISLLGAFKTKYPKRFLKHCLRYSIIHSESDINELKFKIEKYQVTKGTPAHAILHAKYDGVVQRIDNDQE